MRISIFSALLLTGSFPALASFTVEEAIEQVLIGFQQQDAEKINTLIHQDTGLYIMFRRGVLDTYERIERLDFHQPVPEYLPYESLAEDEWRPNERTVHYGELPSFDCIEERWSMAGIFVGNMGEGSLLSEVVQQRKMHKIPQVPEENIAAIKRLESASHRVVAAQDDGASLVFHLSQIQGEWYLTLLDRLSDDCSV